MNKRKYQENIGTSETTSETISKTISGVKKIKNDDKLHIMFIPKFYTQTQPIIDHLKTVTYNSAEESKITIFGKKFEIPRKQVAFGRDASSYTFSGVTVKANSWNTDSNRWIEQIKNDVAKWLFKNIPECFETLIDANPNFCLVNYYENGKNYIGAHSDDENDLKKVYNKNTKIYETIIVSLSFGASRKFRFRNKKNLKEKNDMTLECGDMCIMRGETQKYWKHEIPKQLKVTEPRWNLTFRFMN